MLQVSGGDLSPILDFVYDNSATLTSDNYDMLLSMLLRINNLLDLFLAILVVVIICVVAYVILKAFCRF